MYFAHGPATAAPETLGHRLGDAMQLWFVAVPVVTVVILALVIIALYVLVRYTPWQFPRKGKD